MNFTIRIIPFREIRESGLSEKWKGPGPVPITPERAASQALNPNARPEDPSLWVALDQENRVIGFAGSLPARDIHNGRLMGWNSCWWADSERGREAALPLLSAFIRHWEERVAFADMTERTHAIIRHLDFCHTRKEPVFQFYYRIPYGKILRGWKGAGRFLWKLFFPAVALFNLLQDLRLRVSGKRPEVAEQVTGHDPGEEAIRFISEHNSGDFSRRSMDEFRWALNHPWLVDDLPEYREIQKRYPFSYTAADFCSRWLITRQENKITSVMLVSERDGVLKVLYYFGTEPEDAVTILRREIARNRKLHSLLYGHPVLLSARLQAGRTALYLRRRTRYTGISRKILGELPADMVMQLGDGDAMFT